MCVQSYGSRHFADFFADASEQRVSWCQSSLGEHDYTPAFYSIITGGSGSGKGRIAALQRMLEPWQQYIYDNSRHQVEEYEELQEAYDNYKMHKRQKQTSKQPLGPAPSKPKVVKQRNLALTGNVTAGPGSWNCSKPTILTHPAWSIQRWRRS